MKRYSSPTIRIHVIHIRHEFLAATNPNTLSAGIVEDETDAMLSKGANIDWNPDDCN